MDKKLILFAVINMLANAGFSLLGPFYPNLAFSRGWNNFIVGIVFAAHALTSFLMSFLYGKLLNLLGKRKILILATLLYSIGAASFGILSFIEDKFLFLGLSILLRVIQGAGSAGIVVSIFSFVPFIYPNSMEKVFQILESCSGFGYILGPMMGAALYDLWGYPLPFFFVGLVMAGLAPFFQIVPSKEEEKIAKDAQEIPYLKFFSTAVIICSFLFALFVFSSYVFSEACIAEYVMTTYNWNQTQVNLLFAFNGEIYMIIILAFYIFTIKTKINFLVHISIVLTALTLVFLGPDPNIKNLFAIGFELSEILTSISFGIISMCLSLPLTLLVKYWIILLENNPNFTEKQKGDGASILFNLSWSMSEFLGPILGGLATDAFSFPIVTSYVGYFLLIFGIVYFMLIAKLRIMNAKKYGSHSAEDINYLLC